MASRRKKIPLTKVLPGLIHLARAFWPQIRGQALLMSLSFVSLFFSIGARVLEPWPIKLIFDWIIMPTDQGTPIKKIFGFDVSSIMADTELLLAILVIAVVVFTALRAFFDYFSRVGMALAATHVITDIRSRLFSHLQKLSLSFHHSMKSGDMVTRFTYDVERLRETVVTALLPLTANLLTIIIMFGVMFWFDWKLALIPLAVLPFFYLSSVKVSRRIQTVVREHRKRDGALAASTAEVIGAIKYVQALSLEKQQEKAFVKQNKKSLKEGAKSQRLAAGLERKVDIILAIATALVLWRGVYLVIDGTITPGTLILFTTYLKFIFRPMRKVANSMTRLSKATASGERLLTILNTEPEIKDLPGSIEARHIEGRILFNNVFFSYGHNKNALSGIDFDISPGERVALVGPSGGGKSTILAMLMRLYDPDEGFVLIDGQDMKSFKVDSIRRQISLVLQDSVLFAVSIRDNIAYGALDAEPDIMDIERAARLANAHDFISNLKNGYETIVGERGATLSGGQLQRIAIARAMIRMAPIMILDEPTHGLDNINRREVNEALERLIEGKTTILVTHDLDASRDFDKILVIDNGRIEEYGNHDTLMKKKGYYYRLYLHQFDKHNDEARNEPVEPAQIVTG